MSGKSEEIRIHCLHIHRHVRHALGTVHHSHSPDAVSFLHDLPHIVLEPQYIGDLRDRNDFCTFSNRFLNILLRKIPIGFQIDVFERCAFGMGYLLPWHEIAVMLGNRKNDLIPCLHIRKAIAVRHEVQCLCGIFSENDFFFVFRTDEFRHALPRRFINVRCLHGKRVGPPMRIRVASSVVAAHGLDHRLRLLRCRSIVQIDNGLAVHPLSQKREITQKILFICHFPVSPLSMPQSPREAPHRGPAPARAGRKLPPQGVGLPQGPARGS